MLVSEPKKIPLDRLSEFVQAAARMREAILDELPELGEFMTGPARLMFDADLKVVSIQFGPVLVSISVDPQRPTMVGSISEQLIEECASATKH